MAEFRRESASVVSNDLKRIHRGGLNRMTGFVLQPWQFLLIGMAGWINRSQQDEIRYLQTENRVLREVSAGNVFC